MIVMRPLPGVPLSGDGEPAGVPGLTWTRGWSIGGWFVPLGNAVVPQLVVLEVDKRSERLADEVEGRPHQRHPAG